MWGGLQAQVVALGIGPDTLCADRANLSLLETHGALRRGERGRKEGDNRLQFALGNDRLQFALGTQPTFMLCL